MKALVVGYGSIGMRHARLLAALGHDVATVCRRPVDERTFPTLSRALAEWSPEYVVIASKTAEHLDDLSTLVDHGYRGAVLIEKPLFHRLIDIPQHAFSAACVGYNLRFHPVLQRLEQILTEAELFAVHAVVGQYLPDWRQTDYRMSYSASAAEGGGVLRDLSHELDYLTWILGSWKRLTATGGHVSHLAIDSDDVFSILFETERCPVVSVNMSYLDSSPRREIVALTDQGSIRADLVSGTIEHATEMERFEMEDNQTYLAEHEAVLSGTSSMACSLREGHRVLRMIDAAERAAAEAVWIHA